MNELKIRSNSKNELIDITENVQRMIEKQDIKNGYTIIYVPHTTAGVTINEGADPSVKRDIIDQLKKIVPENNNYSHIEGNSDAHIKASLLGSSVIVLIRDKQLVLGTWQHIFFYEGDGPRNRKIYIDSVSYKKS